VNHPISHQINEIKRWLGRLGDVFDLILLVEYKVDRLELAGEVLRNELYLLVDRSYQMITLTQPEEMRKEDQISEGKAKDMQTSLERKLILIPEVRHHIRNSKPNKKNELKRNKF
jgi:hypothetical protein